MLLQAFTFKKENKYYAFIPRYAYFSEVDKPINHIKVDDEFIKKVDNIFDNILNEQLKHYKQDKLFIITNTDCDGRCVYCYAKDKRTEKKILTPEKLDYYIKTNEIDDVTNVIIYGGEVLNEFENLVEIVEYLKENYKNVNNIHIVTSLFTDDVTFLKFIEYVNINRKNVSITVSIDPPGDSIETYPRKYNNIKDVYSFLKNRIFAINNNTEIIFGTRATISEWGYKVIDLFNDLNPDYIDKPISVNYDIIKGYEISDNKLQYVISSFIANSDRIINRLIGKTTGTVFHHTFSNIWRYKVSLLNILKNCDGGRGRISITPTGVDICNENVMAPFKTYKDLITFNKIYPFDDECNTCQFKYSCGYHCFNIDKKYRKQYCLFNINMLIESLRKFIELSTVDEIDEFIKNQISNNIISLV